MSLSHRLVEETRDAAWRALAARGISACSADEPRHPRRFVSFSMRVDAAIVLSPDLEPLRTVLAVKSARAVDKVAAMVAEMRRAAPDTAVVRVEAGHAPMIVDGSHDIWIRFVLDKAPFIVA